jgi:hypothetical protein
MNESWVKRVQFSDLDLKYCIEHDPEFVYAEAFNAIGSRVRDVCMLLDRGDGQADVSHAINKLQCILDDMGVIYDK